MEGSKEWKRGSRCEERFFSNVNGKTSEEKVKKRKKGKKGNLGREKG